MDPTKKLSIKRDKNFIYVTNKELDKSIRYDLKTKFMQKQCKNGTWHNCSHQYIFFRGLGINDIDCKEEKFLMLIKKAKKLNPLCRSLSTFISRLDSALIYENYIFEGIETEGYASPYRWGETSILTKPLSFYTRPIIDFFKEENIIVSCNVERAFIENYKLMSSFVLMLKYSDFNHEEKISLFDSVIHKCSLFNELVTEFKYDMKSLCNYCLRYLLPFENIQLSNSFTLLRDYYRMANTIGRNVKKYPKYLRSMHDIISANFNAYKKEYDEKLFYDLQKEHLNYKNAIFTIKTPTTSKEIISEGTSLNHCVGSYIDKILLEETYILFLRKTKDIDTPLITLEYKNNAIIQAKGSYNRPTTEDEKKFLTKYCQKKAMELMI